MDKIPLLAVYNVKENTPCLRTASAGFACYCRQVPGLEFTETKPHCDRWYCSLMHAGVAVVWLPHALKTCASIGLRADR